MTIFSFGSRRRCLRMWVAIALAVLIVALGACGGNRRASVSGRPAGTAAQRAAAGGTTQPARAGAAAQQAPAGATAQPAPAGATTQPAPAGAQAQPAPAGAQLGASVNRLFNDFAYRSAQIAAQLRALRSTGATIARSDALWEAVEPAPAGAGASHFDWGFDDSIAGSLAAEGLAWLPIVDYAPAWARASPALHAPPRSAVEFAAFAAALAARYGPGGSFWRSHAGMPALPVRTYEIWNEPDNAEFYSPQPDPAGYAELYLRARSAIDAVDPGARVIVGGLAHPEGFLPAMVRARPDLPAHVDGVAIHPYGRDPDAVLARVASARRTMQALGLGAVPLYVTEFGWTTRPAHTLAWASEQRRPGYISRTLAALAHSNCGVAAVIAYTWVTPERNPYDREDWYGINGPDNRPTSDLKAFAAGLRAAAAPAPALTPCG